MNKISESQQSEIVQLYLTGDYSQEEIGSMYDVSGVAIYKTLKKHGVPGRNSWAQKDYRKCARCGKTLPMSEYYRERDYWCKQCNSDYYHETKSADSLYAKYDMTESDYLELLDKQNNKCAICGSANGDKGLFVDHDHKTGKVRGLLCCNCNAGIGMLKDNTEILYKAIDYLSN